MACLVDGLALAFRQRHGRGGAVGSSGVAARRAVGEGSLRHAGKVRAAAAAAAGVRVAAAVIPAGQIASAKTMQSAFWSGLGHWKPTGHNRASDDPSSQWVPWGQAISVLASGHILPAGHCGEDSRQGTRFAARHRAPCGAIGKTGEGTSLRDAQRALRAAERRLNTPVSCQRPRQRSGTPEGTPSFSPRCIQSLAHIPLALCTACVSPSRCPP